MQGPFRLALTCLAFGMALGTTHRPASAQDPKPAPNPAPGDYALPGEDPPRPFVPARSRSVEDQKRVEALRDFAIARSFEERRQFNDAIKALESALASDPDSVGVLHRLGRINLALGREEAGLAFAKRLLQVEPGDVKTLQLLVKHFKNDPAALEALLKDAAKNPKLDPKSVGALYIDYELGSLYEASLQVDKAAEAFARVVDAIDEKKDGLDASDLRLFLGDDAAQAYLRYGRAFLQADKLDRAIAALRRGLVYDPDEPLLLLLLSDAFQKAGKPGDALEAVESYIEKRRPQGRESYDRLAQILTSLRREDEIIPRFQKFARDNPKNLALQYALAERYTLAGQPEKAREIFNALLAEQRDTKEFAELFPMLLKEKKAEDLLKVLTRAAGRLRRLDAIQPQIEQLAADPAFTDEVLDAGLKMLAANPPALDTNEGFSVLRNIAIQGKRYEKLATLLRWALKHMPNPYLGYQELILVLNEAGKFDESEAAWNDMVKDFPDERNARSLLQLADIQLKGKRVDKGVATAREAIKLEPNDLAILSTFADLLIGTGRADDGLRPLVDIYRINPNNAELGIQLGFYQWRAGKLQDALATFQGVVERFPNNDDVIKKSRSMLSTVYSDLNDFPRAEAELEVLFNKDPEDAGINNDLGYLYADQGKNLEKAEGMIRKALADDPENGAYLDSLGWVLFKRGKFQEARPPLERAIILGRPDSTIPDHLGDVYFQLKEHAKAKECWEKALKIAAEAKTPDKRLPEIRKKLDLLQQFVPAPKPKTGDTP